MTPTTTREDRVAAFHKAANNKTADEGGSYDIHVEVFSEELAEFSEALAAYIVSATEENRAAMIKEWADVQYTLSAFPWFFNFNGQVAFTRVCDNNDTKIGPDGKVVRREDGKIMKPYGYVPADMRGL